MKTLTFLFFSAGFLLSQTAQYPTSIATPQQLGVVSNGVTGTLNNSLTTSSTSANITNGTCTLAGQATSCATAFKPYMFITVQNEIMQICSLGSATGVTILNFGIVGSACPSISGRGLDGTQVAAHTTPSFPNKIIVSNNITAWTHMADSAEIRAIEKNVIGSSESVKSYGAVCDGGVTDDRIAIQAAIDAVGGGTLTFPKSGACGVSSPGLFLYPANYGITLQGFGYVPKGNYVIGAGSGLVSFVPNPPTYLLTNMAEFCHIRDLYLDGASGASATGLVNVLSTWGTLNNVITTHFSNDGMQMWDEGTPTTTLTSDSIIGATTFQVGSITNNRITFGQDNCVFIVLDYGNSQQEQLPIQSASGTTVTTSSGALNTHSKTTAAPRCHGNTNVMQVDHYVSFNNGGWGFRIIPGSDNNGIDWRNHSSNNNTLGGELWFGSVHRHYGGDYENDAGPAVQLGNASPGLTASGIWGPLGDLEEQSALYNGYTTFCSDLDQLHFTDPSQVIIKSSAASCPSYQSPATGQQLMATGTGQDSNGVPSFWIKSTYGAIPNAIYNGAQSGNCAYPGETIYVPTGTSLISTIQYCINGTPDSISASSSGSTTTLTTGTAPATGFAYIAGYTGLWAALNGTQRVTHTGSTTFTIAVNSSGFGSVTGSPTVVVPQWTPSTSTVLDCGFIDTETGVDTALIGTCPNYSGTSFTNGFHGILHTAHAITSGVANTLRINGGNVLTLASCLAFPSYPINTITSNNYINFIYVNGVWCVNGAR